MPIPLRADYDAARLRSAARESRDAGQTPRLPGAECRHAGLYQTSILLKHAMPASAGGLTTASGLNWQKRQRDRPFCISQVASRAQFRPATLPVGGRDPPRGLAQCVATSKNHNTTRRRAMQAIRLEASRDSLSGIQVA